MVATIPTLGVLLHSRRDRTDYKQVTPGKRTNLTIGSIPLRNQRSKGKTPNDSLFSCQDPEEVQVEEPETALAMRAARMGHWAEVGNRPGSDSLVGADRRGEHVGGQIMRTDEYNVSEWRQ